MSEHIKEFFRMDEEAAKKIEACREQDQECGHIAADDELCRLLRELGFKKTVEAFEKLPKWYA